MSHDIDTNNSSDCLQQTSIPITDSSQKINNIYKFPFIYTNNTRQNENLTKRCKSSDRFRPTNRYALEKMKIKHFHLPSFRLSEMKNDLNSTLFCRNINNCLIHNDKNTELLWEYLCSPSSNNNSHKLLTPSSNKFNTKKNSYISTSDRLKICKKLDETVESLQQLLDFLEVSQKSKSYYITKSKSTSDIEKSCYLSSNLKMFTNEKNFNILQSSNKILSRGINELKKMQMNDILHQQKVEKLSEELNQNQNRRHGYTPSATPSLQNNYDRFDYFMKSYNTPSPVRMVTQNEYKTAIAIFNFNGKSNKELSFNKGDVIKIHKIIDDNWSEGERNGKIGIFPTSYVKMNESATYHNQEKLISIYPFFARNKNELSLKVNEIVTKTRDIDENWIEGVNQHGVVGIFPSNYVKQYNDCNDIDSDFQSLNSCRNNDTYQTSTGLPDRPKTPKFMASLTSQPQPQIAHMATIDNIDNVTKSTQIQMKKQMNFIQKIQEWKNCHEHEGWTNIAKMVPRNSIIYRAIYPYKAQIDGELDLEVNDIIFVVELLPDDYVIGTLLRSGEFGAFPIDKIVKH